MADVCTMICGSPRDLISAGSTNVVCVLLVVVCACACARSPKKWVCERVTYHFHVSFELSYVPSAMYS